MQTPNSPLFPAQKLTLSPSAVSLGGLTGTSSGVGSSTLIPQLPDKPLTETSSIQVYVVPAEKDLFMQGFEPEEYEGRPPTLLRGCLFLRVLKPSKIRSVTLTFKGQQRTDWPEGIPPKKTSYVELNDILSHTWPFYQLGNPLHSANGGADFFQELLKDHNSEVENSTLNVPLPVSRSRSPAAENGLGNFFTRNLSPATSFMRRAASPSSTVNESFSDLTSVLSTETDPLKPALFTPGDYIYNFEHPLHPSIPETSSVTFGEVFYYIEASVVRAGTFKLNLTGKLPINIIRTPSESNMEENEPIIITRDWDDQLRYDIVIGRKSIVLDSYLPLAFRFVPLWGKVALHRIRVYLSENLEYYCQNKKVHRLEPPKKYLLLEHKAKKGKSLLSEKLGQDEDEDDDAEILPKELEFQLFVPRVLSGRIKHEIHPDTSYENIQAHHWIKICLRLSKTDPEDPSKRKHYEILIDSPIHILSSLAAHVNTLLPAYDEHLVLSPSYNVQDHATPPLSPEVIPIDNTTVAGRNILRKGTENSVSLDEVIERPHANFEHITNHNGTFDDSDADMHLEANLYLPPDDNRPEMASPQALPHLGTFNSPIQRPIHFVRKPSINPPPFQENTNDMLIGVDNLPPPAYEEEDHSLSMSPLRIDESSDRGRSKSNLRFPGLTMTVSHEGPVKNLLSQQLRKSESELSRKYESEDISDNVSSVKPPTMSPIRNAVSPNRRATDATRQSNSSANSSDTGLTNSIISSSQSNETKSTHDQDEMYESSNVHKITNRNEKADANRKFSDDNYVPESTFHESENKDKSRQSSILSLTSSLDIPVEHTLPLLNHSSSSLLTPQSNFKSMNSSINSLNDRRTSNVHEITKITDLVEGGFNDDLYRVNDNLSHLRNPRIKKHYQNSDHMSETEINKQRQKSFGVINNNDSDMVTRMSSSSESTVHGDDTVGALPLFNSNGGPPSNTNSLFKPLSGSPAPGLNYGFIIE